MSSLNESTEYNSQNDSIPLDAAPSYTGSDDDRSSIDPYDDESPWDGDEEDEYTGDDDNDGQTSGSRTLDASNSYVTGHTGDATLSQATRSRGDPDGSARGLNRRSRDSSLGPTYHSEAQTHTGYGPGSQATSGSFYSGEYSSGYDNLGATSYGYGDSSIRSPRSGSELSSTFASLYYDNEYIVRTRRTLSFFRRPIYFFLFSLGGSGAIGGVCRAVRVLTKSITLPEPVAAVADRPPGAAAGLPSGYPNVPDWLREVRVSLPAFIERPAEWTLQRHGVPILSELQRASESVVRSVVQGVRETWRVSGPMVPIGIFLPLFTFGALQIASKVMSRRPAYGDSADFDFYDSASNYDGDANHSAITRDSPARTSFSDGFSLSSPPRGGDLEGSVLSGAPAAASPDRSGGRNTTTDRSGSHYLGSTIPTLMHPTDSPEHGAGGAPLMMQQSAYPPKTLSLGDDHLDLDGLRARSETQPPPTSRAARSTSPGAAVGVGSPPSPATSVDVLGLSPVVAGADASGVSPAPSAPPPAAAAATQRQHQTPVRGDVVAALLGEPTAAEANAVLLAAVKYGCSAVILPYTLSPSDMVAVPPSLDVEYVSKVVERAAAVAQRRSLAMTTVFRSSTGSAAATAASPLPYFIHPANALYIFMPAAVEATREAAAAAAMSVNSVFVSESGRGGDGVPVNECLYDRLAKERR